MLDHWDNLNGIVERGYAGLSIWDWQKLPDSAIRATPIMRAPTPRSASTASCSTMSARSAEVLTAPTISPSVAALADVFRPYGIRVYLIGPLHRADRDRRIEDRRPARSPRCAPGGGRRPTRSTALIPDFGGFLVKANSEGQPGPQDYGRTHADGANMLADALAPHRRRRDVARLRLFAGEPGSDRAKQAYDEFVPLDGQFRRQRHHPGQERPDRLPAARAVPSRCSARCRIRLSRSSFRSPRNISASPPTSPISGRCGRRCSTPTPIPTAPARPWRG